MNFTPQATGGMAILAIVSALVSIVTTVFWLVVGWRAMRAHEELVEALRERLPR